MLIKSKQEKKKLIDIEKDKISNSLKLKLIGKQEVYGEDYTDDDFYTTEISDMLIDTVEGFIYIQETKVPCKWKKAMSALHVFNRNTSWNCFM